MEIRIPVLATCTDCNGTGAKAGTSASTCPDCNGVVRSACIKGFFSSTNLSRWWSRQVITDPCRTCGGAGSVERQKTLSVKIPAGVDNGDRIRLSGEGEAGPNGGPAGDLYVQIEVNEHPIFVREGRHLY